MKVPCLLCLLMTAAPLRAEGPPLTLPGAYRRTLERSEALQIGEAEWRAAEARYRRAIGGRWPEVRAEASALARESNDEVAGIGAGVTWTLFDGFRSLRDAEARRAEGEAVRFDTARARQLLYEDVASAYFEALARDGEDAALANEEAALEARVAELEMRLAVGRSRRAELLAARTQVADIRVEIAQARMLRDAARELLAFLTGLPADDLVLAPPDALPAAEQVAAVLAAEADRPDLLAAAKRIEAAQREVEGARAEQGVKVTADGNLYLWRDPADEDRWDLALRVELPLFDRGVREAAVAERLESVRVRELRLSELGRIATRDVRLALRETLGGLTQWSALQAALAVAEESWQQQQRDYELGRAGNIDVQVALAQLHSVRRREAVLAMRVRAALVRLQVAAGSGLP
jgi:outer membrane protein